MAYTAIPNGDVDADSPITTGLMTKLRDNPIAIANGDAGAPSIQLAAMAANSVDTSQIVAAAVGRSEIANSTTTSAGSLTVSAHNGFTLNDWALFPMIHTSNITNATNLKGHETDGGSGAAPRFSLYTSTAATYDIDHRWIIAA